MNRIALVFLAAAIAAPAVGEVATFQQGVAPSGDYTGCVDTYVVGQGWAFDRPSDRPNSPVLSGGGKSGALIRFDLSAIPADHAVRKAVLRLYFASLPALDQQVDAYALAHEWDQSATWFQWKYEAPPPAPPPTQPATGARPAPSPGGPKYETNLWTRPGGDLDETDYGKQATDGKGQKAPALGLIDRQTVRGGPFGHIVELDVTPVVSAWVTGKKPNYGFVIGTPRGGYAVTSSDWPIPAYRPALLVEHYRAGQQPSGEARLTLAEALGAKPKLSPWATTTQPAGAAVAEGQFVAVRFGQNSNCQYRTGQVCGYAKQDPRFAGNWGWTPRLRVGGTAGDLNHALFYFDVSAITKPHGDTEVGPLERVKVRRAVLKVFVDIGSMRLPEDTLGQEKVARPIPSTAPNSPSAEELAARQQQQRVAWGRQRMGQLAPYSFGLFAVRGPGEAAGWKQDEFTFAGPRPSQAWTAKGGTLTDVTETEPVAVANVGEQWKALLAARDNNVPETWLEFDVTNLVRGWANTLTGNYGLVLDNRLMGGEMVLFSDDWIEPDRRPYLEVEVSPAPTVRPEAEMKVALAPNGVEPPTGDYWVEPMRKAHQKFKGVRGAFGQYGDSITITMAFWTPLSFGEYKGLSDQTREGLETARKVILKDCWRQWKGPEWGNNGNMTIDWAFRNVDAWQKKMNPEVAVILFGTNDAGYGPHPPIYTEKYAAVVDRILADGGIPIITVLPPRGSQVGNLPGLLSVLDFRQAAIAVAKAKKVPLIDFYSEIVQRQPEQWPKLLIPDGLHPSYPKDYQQDFTDEGLKNSGYTLRNYLTLRVWYEIYRKVLMAEPPGAGGP